MIQKGYVKLSAITLIQPLSSVRLVKAIIQENPIYCDGYMVLLQETKYIKCWI